MMTKSRAFFVAFSVALSAHVVFFALILLIPKSNNELNISRIQVRYVKETTHAANSPVSASSKKTLAPALSGIATGAETKDKNDSAPVLGSDLGISVLYPRLSRMLGEQGKVIVEIQRRIDSSKSLPIIKTSSGFARLDQSAIASTKEALERGLLSEFSTKNEARQISFIFKLSRQ